jgi:hypothetical protein
LGDKLRAECSRARKVGEFGFAAGCLGCFAWRPSGQKREVLEFLFSPESVKVVAEVGAMSQLAQVVVLVVAAVGAAFGVAYFVWKWLWESWDGLKYFWGWVLVNAVLYFACYAEFGQSPFELLHQVMHPR